MEEFKGNSNARKQPSLEREKITPITTNVTVKKQSEFKKFKSTFFAEDAKTVKGQVFRTVIVPSIQRLITDTVKSGIDVLIYGGRTSDTRRRDGYSNISYSSYYDRNRPNDKIPDSVYDRDKNAFLFRDVVLFDRGEAEEVLLQLNDLIIRYGMASVADFYDMIGRSAPYTANNYGWRNLRDVVIIRVPDGYSIDFPKAIPLN